MPILTHSFEAKSKKKKTVFVLRLPISQSYKAFKKSDTSRFCSPSHKNQSRIKRGKSREKPSKTKWGTN